jgi:hypothetical protein
MNYLKKQSNTKYCILSHNVTECIEQMKLYIVWEIESELLYLLFKSTCSLLDNLNGSI